MSETVRCHICTSTFDTVELFKGAGEVTRCVVRMCRRRYQHGIIEVAGSNRVRLTVLAHDALAPPYRDYDAHEGKWP